MKRLLSDADKAMVSAYYESMAKLGVRLIALAPFDKRVPKGLTWEQSVLSSPAQVIPTLVSGRNVGLLLVGKYGRHPNTPGLFVLDKDSDRALTTCNMAPFSVQVSRGHPEKAHFLARMEDLSFPRHSRHISGSHDVKVTGIVVGPGSRHKDGGIYRVFRRVDDSAEWSPWLEPIIDMGHLPALDPADYMLATQAPIARGQHALAAMAPEWREVVGEADEWANLPYSTDPRPIEDRLYRARGYLKNRMRAGYVSRSGKGGRTTLLVVTTHLRKYLRLPGRTCLLLLQEPLEHGHSWNGRCCHADTGRPFPWSVVELASAISASEHLIPGYGVVEALRGKARLRAAECFDDYLMRINWHCEPARGFHTHVSSNDLYQAFLSAYRIDDQALSLTNFQRRMAFAARTGKVRLIHREFDKHMMYRGLFLNKFISLIMDNKMEFSTEDTI